MEGSEKKGDTRQALINKVCVMTNEEVMSAEIFILEYTAEDKTTWTIQVDGMVRVGQCQCRFNAMEKRYRVG